MNDVLTRMFFCLLAANQVKHQKRMNQLEMTSGGSVAAVADRVRYIFGMISNPDMDFHSIFNSICIFNSIGETFEIFQRPLEINARRQGSSERNFFNNSQIWNVCFALTPDHRANEHFVLGKLFLRVKTSRSSKLSLHKNKSLFRALVNIELCLRNVYHSENVCKMNYVWRKFTHRTHAFMKRRLTVGWTDG